MIKTVKDIDLAGAKVLMRVDFNVPIKDAVVQDDTRIRAALPTINYILAAGAQRLVLMSHLGDPDKDAAKAKDKAQRDGKAFDIEKYLDGKHRMKPVADYLAGLLGRPVVYLPSCKGQKAAIEALPVGSVVMLENTRFHKEESSKDPAAQETLAKELASYGDVYVNDAFGTAHRAHASTAIVAKFSKISVGGLLMEKEVAHLEPMLKSPPKPMVAIIGGAKISTKIAVLQSLIRNADAIVIGGGMAYTFLKAKRVQVGLSLVEPDFVDMAKELLTQAEKAKVQLLLPLDHTCASSFSPEAKPVNVAGQDIPADLMGMDVGPKSLESYKTVLASARSVLWNGPMGVFEFDTFAKGTQEVAKAVAEATERGALTVVGGGDSVAAVNKYGLADKMSHVSTGGGASLEYLEGKVLPGIACLEEK